MKLFELFDNALDYEEVKTGHYTFTTPNGQKGLAVLKNSNPPEVIDFIDHYIRNKHIDQDKLYDYLSIDSNIPAIEQMGDNIAEPFMDSVTEFYFEIDGETKRTDKGEAQEIFATVIAIGREHVAKYNPPIIYLSGDGDSRVKLYRRMTRVLGKGYNTFEDKFGFNGANFLMLNQEYTQLMQDGIKKMQELVYGSE